MEREFEGRVALVTGAAGIGIGRAIAHRLAASGAKVVVTDVHPRRTEIVSRALAEACGAPVAGYVLDVSDNARVEEVVADVRAKLGPIQILVNNAAVNIIGSIFDYEPKDWLRVMDVDLNGPWYLSRAVMPQMREAGGGAIVNISSIAPDSGGGMEAPYAIAKGGMNVLTRSCAREGGAHGIRCNTVLMGAVARTRFIMDHPEILEGAMAKAALGFLPEPEDIAEAVAFLASERARCITGQTLNVDSGGWMRP